MWLALNDAWLSIVASDEDLTGNTMIVRARVRSHLTKYFDEPVVEMPGHDYAFRCFVKRSIVKAVLVHAVHAIDYPNFKNSVKDSKLNRLYSQVWGIMAQLQVVPPFSTYLGKKHP